MHTQCNISCFMCNCIQNGFETSGDCCLHMYVLRISMVKHHHSEKLTFAGLTRALKYLHVKL